MYVTKVSAIFAIFQNLDAIIATQGPFRAQVNSVTQNIPSEHKFRR